MRKINFLVYFERHITGPQPEIFQGRTGFLEFGHFDQHFVKNTEKKAPQGKVLELFLLDTLKTTFWMENLTQRWIQSGPFFQNQGAFFYFQKRAGEASPPPILVARLHYASFISRYRRSRPKVFCKKSFLENFAKFTGKHLC